MGRITTETIEAIERDAGAGMSVDAIAKKHGVSWPTAKRYAPLAKKTAKAATRKHRGVAPADVNGAGQTITLSRELLRALVRLIPHDTREAILLYFRDGD